MTRFGVFAALYMAANFLELAEKWTDPGFTLGVLLLGIGVIATGLTRRSFCVFLAVVTLHMLLVQFPDVANHVNVQIYCNVLLMAGIAYSLARPTEFPTDDDYFEMTRPVLQASLALVYLLAGFHKLNTDFLDPGVSCVGEMVGDLTRLASASALGVPVAWILVAGISIVPDRLLSSVPAWRRLPLPARLALIGCAGLAAFTALGLVPAIPPERLMPLVFAMAVIVILWELVGGALLAVPRLQAPLLLFSWTMHATLSLIGFVDFGALALALLFTFVPRPYQERIAGAAPVRLAGRSIHRMHLYLALVAVGGALSGLHRRLAAALAFNVAVLVLLWPLLLTLIGDRSRPAWHGVGFLKTRAPRCLFVFPVLLLLHGLTSYAGLRTAGNFSMFSNLRTEGSRSNHLLLGGNPLKRWDYQEDAVRFVRIDDRRAAIGYNYQPLEGNALPVVEFRKLIYAWTRAGVAVPMTFGYRRATYVTDDITREPAWRTAERTWAMRLLDFRVIQPEGPNRCRW